MAILALSLSSVSSIFLVALGLGFVIFIHELGHFAVAKWCNVNVERFSIGFGPVIWSRTWGETEYALSLVPFGGYVKMLGQDDMDPSQETDEDIADDPRSYTAKSVPQRMAIISAGVIMNLLTAVPFFMFAFKLGVEYTPAIIGHAIPGDPAWEAGLRTGDELIQINDRTGRPLRFIDLKQEVALSSEDVHVKGIRKFYDGVNVSEKEFEATMTPETGGLIPTVGVTPIMGMKLPLVDTKNDSVVAPGAAASHASPPFEGGDEIVKIDEVDISGYADLQNVLAVRRDREVVFTVRRGDEELGINVGPNYFRTLGLKMDIGPISNIQEGSPAAAADPPLQVNDKITHIISDRLGEREVGADLNALELPDYLAALQGEKVHIRVKRETAGEETSVECTLTPDGRQGWTETPLLPSSPLTVPSIGIGYQVLPYILNVEPGSPADGEVNRDGKSNVIMTIKQIQFFPPLTTDEKPIEFSNKKGEMINWAHVFWQMQVYPERTVSLTVAEQGSDTEYTTAKLSPRPRNEAGKEWYLPIRGIKLSMLVKQRKADTYGESFSLAYDRTRASLLEIYLTLRNLFSGRVSPKALRGPLTIASTAYYFSEKGLGDLLWFLGLLSISLAVLNFLPIPVLDGGHMVFLIWEAIRGKPASERVMIGANYVGLFLVLCLMVWVLSLDIFAQFLGWWKL